MWYTEGGDIEIEICKGYEPLINVKWKENDIPLSCIDIRIKKLNEMIIIITEIAKRLNFIENDYEE